MACSANIAPSSFDHPADLGVARLAADPVQGFRLREAGRFEEDTREFGVGVLAGVQETGLFSQHPHNRGKLNNFRARANHDSNVQVVGICGHKRPLRPDYFGVRSG